MSKDDLPIEKINKLSEILKEQGLTEIEIESDNLKIKVRKESATVMASAPVAQASAPASTPAASASSAGASAANANLLEIKSPMVGTFYASPSPDSQPYVKIGPKIKKGDTLCIVEAMKLMNELPSEVEGEIVEILVSNSDAISFGQVLMRVKKA